MGINYDKLAIAIINEWESEREESGRSELARGMRYVLEKYEAENYRELIDEMLMTFTGWKLESLLKIAEEISDDEL